MIKTLRAAALTLLCLAGASQAGAAASATLTVGDTTVSSTSGMDYNLIGHSIGLDPGEAVEFWWDYSLLMQDDGLTASRTWNDCAPITGDRCGPEPTGYELAIGYIDFVTRRDNDPWLEFTFLGEMPWGGATQGDALADTFASSGSFGIRLTNLDEFSHGSADFILALSVFVDASSLSPVDEPPTALMLGIGVLALVARRRRPS